MNLSQTCHTADSDSCRRCLFSNWDHNAI